MTEYNPYFAVRLSWIIPYPKADYCDIKISLIHRIAIHILHWGNRTNNNAFQYLG